MLPRKRYPALFDLLGPSPRCSRKILSHDYFSLACASAAHRPVVLLDAKSAASGVWPLMPIGHVVSLRLAGTSYFAGNLLLGRRTDGPIHNARCRVNIKRHSGRIPDHLITLSCFKKASSLFWPTLWQKRAWVKRWALIANALDHHTATTLVTRTTKHTAVAG